jgi:hypothetical protein
VFDKFEPIRAAISKTASGSEGSLVARDARDFWGVEKSIEGRYKD